VLPSIETAKKEKAETERKREREERYTSPEINIGDSVSIMHGMPYLAVIRAKITDGI
jgi:hypothetical protein